MRFNSDKHRNHNVLHIISIPINFCRDHLKATYVRYFMSIIIIMYYGIYNYHMTQVNVIRPSYFRIGFNGRYLPTDVAQKEDSCNTYFSTGQKHNNTNLLVSSLFYKVTESVVNKRNTASCIHGGLLPPRLSTYMTHCYYLKTGFGGNLSSYIISHHSDCIKNLARTGKTRSR